MPLQTQVVTFTKSTNQATPFELSYTGAGFQPEAIIFYSSCNTSGTPVTDGNRGVIGFVQSDISQRAIGWASDDAVSTSNAARIDTDQYCFRQLNGSGTDQVLIQFVQFELDGFRIRYVQNSAEAYQIHALCIGGTDLTQVKVGTISSPVVTGNQDTTNVGFVPDMLFFMSAGVETEVNLASTTGAKMMFGACSSNAKRGVVTMASRDSLAASDTARQYHSGKAIQLLNVVGNVTGKVLEADMTLKLTTPSSEGFRLNWTTVDTSRSLPVFYMALKGGNWDVNSTFLSRTTSAANQTYSTTFQPKMIMATSVEASTNDSNTTNARLSIGAATSDTAHGSIWFGDEDAKSPTQTASSTSTTQLIATRTTNATGANSALTRAAALVSFNASPTGYTLNWTNVDATAVYICVVTVGDSPAAPGPQSNSCTGKYDIRKAVDKTVDIVYSLGGAVEAGPFTHTYDILGPFNKSLIVKYGIRNFVRNSILAKYHISNLTVSAIGVYKITSIVKKSAIAKYEVEEHPSLNLKRYMKVLGLRIFIMSHDQRDTYHVFNSFDLSESTIKVLQCSVELSINDAGTFQFRVEDSGHGINTSLVGEGNAVLIQAAKTQQDLGDGAHNLIFGYITEKAVLRPDTDALEYEFRGAGSMIRFNERITSFSRSARRIKHDSPEPDPSDPEMQAWRLFSDLLEKTDHLPVGGPTESQFTLGGVKSENDPSQRVDAFIANIDEELAEMSSPLDTISEQTGASWGVSYNPNINDVFLKYATLQPSSIVIKSGSDIEDPNEDRYNTCYIVGDWSFIDNRDKSQGFTNRFIARVGAKDATANVIEISDIINEYTPLAVDEPPTDEAAGTQLPENEVAAFGPIINLRSDLIGPNNSVWTAIANYAREFDFNVFYCILKIGVGDDGPGPSIGTPVWITPWNVLTSAGVRILGYIDTNKGAKTIASVKEEIDRWFSTWGPYGIYFENMSVSTSNVSYYKSISDYAKQKGFYRVVANAPDAATNTNGVPNEYFATCSSIDTFVVWEGAKLPSYDNIWRSHYSNYPEGKRAVFAHSVTTSNASDDDVAQWTSDLEVNDLASYFYVTDDIKPQPYDKWSNRFRAMMYGAEAAAIRIFQNNGFIVPGVPVQQDLAMSFIADSQSLGDVAIILSRVGNPLPDAGETGREVFLEILTNRQVQVQETDPETEQTITKTVDMPSYAPAVAEAKIPFVKINNEYPTVIFLHSVVKRKQDLVVGQRYWVVIYGRGQNEKNTIRWHHASQDNDAFDYLAAIRVPATINRNNVNQRQHWQVFTKTTHPGFALTYFKNTTRIMEASDTDSIKRFGLVESELDLTGIDDDALAIKTLQAILYYSAKPKRSYDISQVTTPDSLILPGQLVRIQDDMTTTGQVTGSTAEGTEAEILSSSYEFDAYDRPMGCRYVQIDAIGHVDFAWAYWYALYKRGEISVDFPEIIPIPPGPPPDNNGPVILAQPKGGRYYTAIRVIFTSNKVNTKVFYTTNGTTPKMTGAGLPLSENDTKIFYPGQSPPIAINETTTLKFQGVDANGNKSTVYTEHYTISIPTPPGGGKKCECVFFLPCTLNLISTIFRMFIKPLLDNVSYFVRLDELIDNTWKNTVLSMPAKFKEIEFQSYAQCVANIDAMKAAGFNCIGYAIERDDTPANETRDVVGYCKKFSALVRSRGLKVKFNPRADYCKIYASRIAPYCDYFNIQAHTFQGDLTAFKTFVRDISRSVRANNINAVITITLSASEEKNASLPDMTRLDTLKTDWTFAKELVDGVRTFYSTDTELNDTVRPFIEWYTNNGRSL